MKKNIITVIYPAEFRSTFIIESDETVETILEQVFEQWNAGSGQESDIFKQSRVRSLSVDDIVCVNGVDYHCKGSGWSEITLQYTMELENEVRAHPSFKDGARFVLAEIMWKRCQKTIM